MQQQDSPRNQFQGMFRGLYTVKGFMKYGIIAIVVVAVLIVIYYNTQMRPHDLLSFYATDETPAAGLLVRYDSEQHRSELDVEGEEMIADLWQAIEGSQVRYMQHISSAAVSAGGYYYEVMLSTPEDQDSDTHTYAFSVNTAGETVIQAMTYRLVDEQPMLDALDALFTQYEDQVRAVS